MDPHRVERIAEALREELTELVEYELEDPRLNGVTVNGVSVTPDMRHAHALIGTGGTGDEGEGALAALEHASSLIRRELLIRLNLNRLPEIHFVADSPTGPAARVEELLGRVRKARKKEPGNPEK
jgi:ribosome-binding factor A